MRGSTSKKRSGANSNLEPPPDQPVFYLDKCLGRRVVAQALRAAGARVELHTDHFAEDAPDEEWLPAVGQKGWLILTKDSKLLTNQLEVIALLKSGTATFALRAADMTGEDMARSFVTALPQMLRFRAKFQPPFLANVTRSGRVSIYATFHDLIRKVR